MAMKTEDVFVADLVTRAYASANRTGRYPRKMLDLLAKDSATVVAWFKKDLARKRVSKGFQRMMTAGLPDLTAEQAIRDGTYTSIFDATDRARAAARLAQFGY